MSAFAEMLNNPLFNFRKVIKVDLKSLLPKILAGDSSYKRLMLAAVSFGKKNRSAD